MFFICHHIAAITAYAAIHQFQPDIILNAGTAGGFKSKGASIGDGFIGTYARHHDRRIPIPGFSEYGRGHHVAVSCPNLIQVATSCSTITSLKRSSR